MYVWLLFNCYRAILKLKHSIKKNTTSFSSSKNVCSKNELWTNRNHLELFRVSQFTNEVSVTVRPYYTETIDLAWKDPLYDLSNCEEHFQDRRSAGESIYQVVSLYDSLTSIAEEPLSGRSWMKPSWFEFDNDTCICAPMFNYERQITAKHAYKRLGLRRIVLRRRDVSNASCNVPDAALLTLSASINCFAWLGLHGEQIER